MEKKSNIEYRYQGKVSGGMVLISQIIDKKELFGYVNSKGEIVIPCIYETAWDFQHGLARVKGMNGKWGYIDDKGNVKISIIYEQIQAIDQGFIFGQLKGKWGGIEVMNFQTMVSFKYDWIFPWKEDLAVFKLGGKYGALNLQGEEVVHPVYEEFQPFNSGLAAVKNKGKWGYIDSSNLVVIPFSFDNAWPFNNGKAQVEKRGEFLFINTLGNLY